MELSGAGWEQRDEAEKVGALSLRAMGKKKRKKERHWLLTVYLLYVYLTEVTKRAYLIIFSVAKATQGIH